MQKWHTLSTRAVLANLNSRPSGLSSAEAARRLAKWGPNELRPPKPRAPVLIFLSQFASALVLLLIAAAVIATALGRIVDTIVIAAILTANATLGFIQEWRAERTIAAMRRLIIPTATVLRDGQRQQIDSRQLVPGDIIFLSEGQHIPADCRIMASFELRTDESALTGESTPVQKTEKVLTDVPPIERVNMAFMGTMVVAGSGQAVVVSTGINTELGGIAQAVVIAPEITTLQKRIGAFGKWLGLIVIAAGTGIFALGLATGKPPFDMFLTAIALAVAAVPEGLPAIVTVALAAGVLVMAQKRAIVRRLTAIEELGAITVVAADKTGTMTKNEMTVRRIWCAGKQYTVTGLGFEPKGEFRFKGRRIEPAGALKLLLTAGAACNNALLRNKDGWHIVGDPTDGALLVAAAKAGLPLEWERLWEIPFSSERARMTTVNNINGELFVFTKGAPEKLLELCDRIQDGHVRKLTVTERQQLLEIVHVLAAEGMRVIGLAYSPLKAGWKPVLLERELIFIGLVAMEDPPRPEIAHSLAEMRAAGIQTIMLTGDHALTAQAIAREIGLPRGLVVTGAELDAMDEPRLQEVINDVAIFARITPAHKVRIVRALRAVGHVPAVTGDGVNDAPALKLADVGIAMGIKGTDVAKESSDVVLIDDNYATIAAAVEWGRHVYDNIRKFIRFTLSTNFTEIMLISTAMFAGFPLPLLPLQILWINLVTETPPALALIADPREPGIMRRKPRSPKAGLLSGMVPFILVGAVLCAGMAGLAYLSGLGVSTAKAQTMAFATIIVFKQLFIWNCRSERRWIWKTGLDNSVLLATVVAMIGMQIAIIQTPALASAFGAVPLALADWATIAVLALPALFVPPWLLIKHK